MAESLFIPYKGKLLVESGPFLDTDEYIRKRIEDHTFNYSVQVLIPGMNKLPSSISDWLTSAGNQQYYTAHLPVHKFIDLAFVQDVIRKGKFTALSRSHVDTDDSIAVIPPGILYFSLMKDTYQQLGLNGKSSSFKGIDRYIVQVDLLDPAFKSGSKLYNRIKWCLTTKLQVKFEFLISWIPDLEIHTTLESWLEGYQYSKRQCSNVDHHYKNLIIPEIVCSFPQGFIDRGEDVSCDAFNFYQWLGALSCNVDCCAGSADDFVSTYSTPTPNQTVPESVTCKCLGLITTSQINRLVKDIRNHTCWSQDIPWIAVNVWGFHDSPVSWKLSEHNYFVCGDNNYTIVIFPNTSSIWFIFATSTYDSYS